MAVAMSTLKELIKGGVTKKQRAIKLKKDDILLQGKYSAKNKVLKHLACRGNSNPAVLPISRPFSTHISS